MNICGRMNTTKRNFVKNLSERVILMTFRVSPYLIFDGNAIKAIHFYEKAFNVKASTISMFADMPEAVPDAVKHRVAHARMVIGETELLISDSAGSDIQIGNHITICIHAKDSESAKQVYDVLREDGQIGVPLQVTSFSSAFANVTDQFGVTFQIIAES